jgi:flagellar hook assembly protein FlgD
VGVEEIIPDSAPRNFILAINRPNPFQSATNISFALPGSGETDLSIYDITGQKVITLYNGRLEAGSYSYSWSGIDDSGRELSSGIYFYRLSAGDFTSTKKLVLIR